MVAACMTPQEVLVVDDDADLRVLMGEILREAGYFVIERNDVNTALAQIMSEPPDAAVIDYRLPDGHGTEVSELLRLLGIPSMIVSAHPRPAATPTAVTRWIEKPFGIAELVGAVGDLLGGRPTPAA